MDPNAVRDNIDARIMAERQEMDLALWHQRSNMDRVIRVERENMDMIINNERESMDAKLKEERQEIDRIMEMQRINAEAEKMQLRVDMEAKLLHAGISHDEDLVMEFRVHMDGQFSLNPKGYFGGRTGFMRFMKPAKVEWWLIKEADVKGSDEVYYLHPEREAPEGLVLMDGPEQVVHLLHDHFGKKTM